jgi:hypothetical protein
MSFLGLPLAKNGLVGCFKLPSFSIVKVSYVQLHNL